MMTGWSMTCTLQNFERRLDHGLFWWLGRTKCEFPSAFNSQRTIPGSMDDTLLLQLCTKTLTMRRTGRQVSLRLQMRLIVFSFPFPGLTAFSVSLWRRNISLFSNLKMLEIIFHSAIGVIYHDFVQCSGTWRYDRDLQVQSLVIVKWIRSSSINSFCSEFSHSFIATVQLETFVAFPAPNYVWIQKYRGFQ